MITKEQVAVPMDAVLVNETGTWKVGKSIESGFNWGIMSWHPILKEGGIMGRLDHSWYLYHYASLLPPNSKIVEIGTRGGASAVPMAMAIKANGGRIYTCDPSMMTEQEREERKEEFKEYEILNCSFDLVTSLINETGYADCIELFPDSSMGMLKKWDKGEIDMLFVDGTHEYLPVLEDCKWMDLVKVGGIAVFDDWIAPVEKAVREYTKDKPEWTMFTSSTDQPKGCPWKTVWGKSEKKEVDDGIDNSDSVQTS